MRVLPLTNQVYPAYGRREDRRSGRGARGRRHGFFARPTISPSADEAAKEALNLNEGKVEPPPLRAEVVALALILDKKTIPRRARKKRTKPTSISARSRRWRGKENGTRPGKRAGVDEFGEVVRFRAQLAIAAAAVDNRVPDTTDVEAAIKLAEGGLSNKAELSWPLLRLTQLALATSLPQERVQALADNIGNSAVRGRAQLAIFRARLAQSKQPVEDSAADKIEANSLARSLAAQALARHNTRLGANYAGVVQNWPQPLKSFGSLGIALGLQDRDK